MALTLPCFFLYKLNFYTLFSFASIVCMIFTISVLNYWHPVALWIFSAHLFYPCCAMRHSIIEWTSSGNHESPAFAKRLCWSIDAPYLWPYATQQPLPGASALHSPCARTIDVLLTCLSYPGPWTAIAGIDIALVLVLEDSCFSSSNTCNASRGSSFHIPINLCLDSPRFPF